MNMVRFGGRVVGIEWGRLKEGGVWLASVPQYRLILRRWEVYIAVWRFRVRLP